MNDTPSCYKREDRKAHKSHTCSECLGVIQHGETYHYHHGVWCGKPAHYKICSDVWSLARERGGYVHPTQKPVAMVERALRNSSRSGDLVLDSFTGGGTTLIACQRMGRRFAGLELDPIRCDVSLVRWEEFTGQKAERAK